MGDAARQNAETLQFLGVLELLFKRSFLFLSFFPGSNFLVDAQQTADLSLGIEQRHLGGAYPNRLTIWCGLLNFDADFWRPGIHNPLVIGTIKFSLSVPAHLKIILAQHIFGL